MVLDGDSSTTIPSSGSASPRVAWTVEGLSGSDSGGATGAPNGSGAGRSEEGRISISASSVSFASATIASPIGARAASSGSLVTWTSDVPSGRSRPGM